MRLSKLALIGGFLIGWSSLPCQAQQPERVAVPLSNPGKPVKLEVSLMRGGITVKSYTGNEVIVETRVRQGGAEEDRAERGHKNLEVEGKARGMKRLTNPTAGLEIEEENNNVSVHSGSLGNAVDLVIQVPAATSVKASTIQDGDVVVEGVTGEIEASSTTGNVTLKGISGAVVANALAGDINAVFTQLAADKTMSFTNLSGDIDLTLPAAARAKLKMKSDMGDIYSDFDMTMETVASGPQTEKPAKAGKFRVKIEKSILGTINGGGPELQLKTFTGSIYIRKAGK